MSESPGLKLSEESIQSDSISNFSKSSVKTYVENKKKLFLETKDKVITKKEVDEAFEDLVVTQNYFSKEFGTIIDRHKNSNYPKLYKGNDSTSDNYFGFLSIPGDDKSDIRGFFKIVAFAKTKDEIDAKLKKYIETSNTSDTIIIGQDFKWTALCKDPTIYTKNRVVFDKEDKENVTDSFETMLQQKKEYITERPDYLNDPDSNPDYKYSKHFANINHLSLNHEFMKKKTSLFESYIKMKYESFRREKETSDWYEFYYKSFESIGVTKIDSKEELMKKVEKYKNNEYIGLSDSELLKLQSKTINEINSITVF